MTTMLHSCVYGLEVVTPEDDDVVEPVTLAEAKTHLNIDDSNTDNDDRIELLITAARQFAERETKRAITAKLLRLSLTSFPDEIWLPGGFVQSVESVENRDTANAWQTVDEAVYEFLPTFSPPRIVLAANQYWPSVGTGKVVVRVGYTAGYDDDHPAPKTLKQAILLLIGQWHYQRGDDAKADVPMAVKSLLAMWTLPQYE